MIKRSHPALFEVAYFSVLSEIIWLVHVALTKAHGPLGWIWNLAALLAVVAFGTVIALRRHLVENVMRRP